MKFTALSAAFLGCSLLFGHAVAQETTEKALVEKWLDGEVEWTPEISYDGKPITLRFNSFLGPQTPTAVVMQRAFDRLEEDTGGKLKVRPFWSNTLADAGVGGFEAISGGIAEMGSCYTMMNPGGFSLQLGLQMPFLIERSTAGSMTANRVYAKYARDTYENRGVYMGRIAYTPPNQILTIDRPIKKLEDLKGMKMWASGDLPTKIAEALGGVPVPVAVAELYVAMQTGVVDVMEMHDAGTITFRLNELAKYRTKADLWANPTEYCVNQDFFDGLPDDLKKTFYHWLQLWNFAEAKVYYDDLAKKGNQIMRDKGIEFIDLDEAERARWEEALAPVEADWVARMEADGKDGAGFLKDFRASYSDLSAQDDDALFQQLLDNPIPDMISNYTYEK